MIRYYKLFDLLNRRNMKKTDLLEVISAPTLAKLSKGKNIQTDNIDKICLFLGCQPSDIMEVIFDEQIGKNDFINKKETVYTKPVLTEAVVWNDNINDIDYKDVSKTEFEVRNMEEE